MFTFLFIYTVIYIYIYICLKPGGELPASTSENAGFRKKKINKMSQTAQ